MQIYVDLNCTSEELSDQLNKLETTLITRMHGDIDSVEKLMKGIREICHAQRHDKEHKDRVLN